MWSDLVTLSYPKAKQESESKFPLPTQTKTSIEPLMLLLELGRSLKLFPKCIVLCVYLMCNLLFTYIMQSHLYSFFVIIILSSSYC
jgi:hypothetical protein